MQLEPLSDYHRRILKILPKVRDMANELTTASLAFGNSDGEEAKDYRMAAMRWRDLEQRLINRLNGFPKPR